MSHAFHQLYVHFVWRTKDNVPLLEKHFGEELVMFVREACADRGVVALASNAMPDHVHLFVRLPPTIAPAAFIGQIKGASAFAFNRKFDEQRFLKWQDGYGAVSVRGSEQEKVIHYIENQQQIHATRKASRLLEMCSDNLDVPARERAG